MTSGKRKRRTRSELRFRPKLPMWLAEPVLPLQWLLAATVVGSTLAVGGMHATTLVIISLAATALFAMALGLEVRRGRRQPVPGMAVLLLGLALFNLIQLVPLPIALLQRIAPANADIWTRAFLPYGDAPLTSAAITLDPGATRGEVLRWFSYAGVYTAAVALGARRGAAVAVLTVFGSALAAGATTLVHGLVGATKVFGIYEPLQGASSWHVGPLLNPNNLAGYLTLGTICGIGLIGEREPIVPRWVVAIGVASLVGINAATGSRGGLLTMIGGIVAAGIAVEVMARRLRMSGRHLKLVRPLVLIAVAAGGLYALLGMSDSAWSGLKDADVVKLSMGGWVAPVMEDHFWVGIGRGAFDGVFQAYQPADGGVVFSQIENFIATWLVEWGAIVAPIALLVGGWYLRPRPLGVTRSTLAACAWIGAVVVLVQNLADFGLEVPAVCIALVTVLGALWGQRELKRRRSGGGTAVRRGEWKWVGGATVLGLTLSTSMAVAGIRYVDADRAAISALLQQSRPPRSTAKKAELRGFIRNATTLHPAEPHFPLMAAWLAWQERDADPMPFLQRTLERSSKNGRAHLLVALVVHARGSRAQARLELRLAVESEERTVTDAARLAVRWSNSYEELLEAAPHGVGGARMLDTMATLLGGDRRDLGELLDKEALRRGGPRVGPHQRLASDAIRRAAGEDGCDPVCNVAFEANLKALEQLTPKHSTALQLRAEWLAAHGDAERAATALAASCADFIDQTACARTRVAISAKVVAPEPMLAAGEALLRLVCIDRAQCASAAGWIADIHRTRGEWGTALTYLERTVRDEPTALRWVAVANAAEQLGLQARSVRAIEQAQRLVGDDSALAVELERRRAKMRLSDGP